MLPHLAKAKEQGSGMNLSEKIVSRSSRSTTSNLEHTERAFREQFT
jgi:hypothetical protein